MSPCFVGQGTSRLYPITDEPASPVIYWCLPGCARRPLSAAPQEACSVSGLCEGHVVERWGIAHFATDMLSGSESGERRGGCVITIVALCVPT